MTEFYFYFYICFFLCSIIRFTFDFYLNSDILQAVGPHFVVFYCHLRIFIASDPRKARFSRRDETNFARITILVLGDDGYDIDI